MKRAALLLAGVSYQEKYWHHRFKQYLTIDWYDAYENYKEYIFKYFESINCQVDTYICSNPVDKLQQEKLIECYSPIDIQFLERYDKTKPHPIYKNGNRPGKIMKAIDMCLQQNIEYDIVFITRFDMLFKIPFADVCIKPDHINIVSHLERLPAIDDNVHIVPFDKIRQFYKIFEASPPTGRGIECITLQMHGLYPKFCEIAPVNLLYNENRPTSRLSFFNFIRKTTSGQWLNHMV